ncbi:hypothetical protein BGZ54_008661 [Gamsiella multidivaricata]|nr:hypothetical protein BGZ54_008661 [Gamsiella multidivaricata]
MSLGPSASWKSTFLNVPPLTKSVSTAVTLMTALGFLLRLRDLAFSYSAAEGADYDDSEADLYAINTAILLGCGKYLERAWGSREFFKLLCISSIGPMLGIYLTYLFGYVIHGNDELLAFDTDNYDAPLFRLGDRYDTEAYGMTGVLAGFLVGFKQLLPEYLVTIWGALSVRVKSLPLLFTLFMVFEGLISHTQIQFLMAIYGLFLSWIYSRFLRVQNGIRGDRSETFSFASFFPEFIQPPVKAISDFCFGVLVKLHIFSPTGYGGFHYDLENPQMAGLGHTFTQPGSLRAEAERRRTLALKTLDMKIHAAAGNNSPFSGSGRSAGSSSAAPVSLLSLSAEPLPSADDGEDE